MTARLTIHAIRHDPGTRAAVEAMILDLLDHEPLTTRQIADELPAPWSERCWHDGCTNPKHLRQCPGFATSLARTVLDKLAADGIIVRSFGKVDAGGIRWSLPLAAVPETIAEFAP